LGSDLEEEEPMSSTRCLTFFGLMTVAVSALGGRADGQQPAAGKITQQTEQRTPATIHYAAGIANPGPLSATGDDRQREISRRLALLIDMNYTDKPLLQLLEDVTKLTDVGIALDLPALTETGVEPNRLVTISLEGVSLRSALLLVLQKAGLTYTMRGDDLLITTERHSSGPPFIKTYVVSDLLVPMEQRPSQASDKPAANPREALRVQIMNLIAPESWSNAEGPTICYSPDGKSLLVNQTSVVHDQVNELLDALRRIQREQGATELARVVYQDWKPTSVVSQSPTVSSGARTAPRAVSPEGQDAIQQGEWLVRPADSGIEIVHRSLQVRSARGSLTSGGERLYLEGNPCVHTQTETTPAVLRNPACLCLGDSQLQLHKVFNGDALSWMVYGSFLRPDPIRYVQLENSRGMLQLTSAELFGTCERVRMTGKANTIALEGSVHLVHRKDPKRADLRAERIVLNLEDGSCILDPK
jgi:hypothetical protein